MVYILKNNDGAYWTGFDWSHSQRDAKRFDVKLDLLTLTPLFDGTVRFVKLVPRRASV